MKNIAVIVLFIGSAISFSAADCLSESIDNIIKSSSPFSSGTTRAAQSPGPENEAKEVLFSVQTGVYSDPDQADQQVIALKSKGLEPYIFQSKNSRDQTLYAVRIGMFQTTQAATAKLEEIESELSGPAIITPYDSLEPAALYAASPEQPKTAPGQKENRIAASDKEVPEKSVPHAATERDFQKTTAAPEKLEDRLQYLEAEIEQLKEEAEVRRKLRSTEEESSAEQEDILEAAGREYTLTKAGNIEFRYGFGYTYDEYDAIREATRIEDVSNHTISNSFNVSYGVKDNLTVGTGIPFVYKYNRVGTIHEKDITDLGDLSLDWRFQPFKTTSDLPSIIINGGFNVPVGRNPYDIQPGKELSTSSGIYSTSIGASVSQTSDPVVVFSSFSLNYPFSVKDINQKRNEGILDEVDPGIALGISAGMAYALSYKLNFNLSISYSYSFETDYHYKNAPSATTGTSASARLRLGTGYRLSPKQNLNFSFGIPITDTGSFSFSFSTPIEFEL